MSDLFRAFHELGPSSRHHNSDLKRQYQSLLRRLRLISIILIAVLLLGGSIYVVPIDSEGLIYTMGRDGDVVGPGLHLKAPIIQKVHIHPTARAQRVEIGFRTVKSGDKDRPAEYTDAPKEALMLTGDENIVWAEAVIQWRIGDI